MMKRFYFNMIEIILAIAIISIGISSVMVLFTSGIKSGQEAVLSGTFPDISESVLAQIQSEILKDRNGDGWRSDIANIAPVVADADWGIEKDTVDKFDSSLFGISDKSETLTKGTANGYFLYRQLEPVKKEDNSWGYVPVISAIARVRQRSLPVIELSNPHKPLESLSAGTVNGLKNAKGESESDGAITADFRKVIEVRISYPADKVPADRKVKTFVLEYYNDQYKLISSEGVKE